MRFRPRFARGCILAAMALVGAVAGVGATMLRPHDAIPQVADCNVFGGVADFVGASSLDDLLEEADVAIKARITKRSYTYDTETRTGVHPYRRIIFHTVDVLDVLVGDVSGKSVTFGVSFREVCLDPGDEFYLFLARNRETGNPFTQNPVEFGLHSFGPQNVFTVESGVVGQLEGFASRALEQYEGPEESFRKAVIESAARVR